MPTYDYECSKGHHFAVEQPITDKPLKKCPECKAKATRLISATNFILKGSGWYSDGYSSSGGGDSKNSSSGSGSESSSSSSSSSGDSKPSSSSSSSGSSSSSD